MKFLEIRRVEPFGEPENFDEYLLLGEAMRWPVRTGLSVYPPELGHAARCQAR